MAVKKILVTGATGFIGNYVIQELLLKDCMVIATSSDQAKAMNTAWYSQVKYIPFNLKELDNSVDLYTLFGEPTALIHLAWEGLPNYKNPIHVEENLPRQYAFLSNMINNGLNDLLVTGTCFEYGMQEGCLREDMETRPANAYGVAKDQLRKQLEVLAAQRQIHLKWVRLFYMYGKGQSANSLFSQLDRALANAESVFNMSGGEQERDYLPVEEAAANIVAIALQNKVKGIINCCSGIPVAVKDFVLGYLKTNGQNIRLNLGYYPYNDYEPMIFWGDIQKLKKVLNSYD
jgi:nucleoside-diphosphate-sugar epimerase